MGEGVPPVPSDPPAWAAVERELCRRAAGWWDRVTALVPELQSLDGVAQPPRYHGEGDVATHTRLAVEACPADADPDLLWAALLHDVGKPATTRIDGDSVTSHDHARVGCGDRRRDSTAPGHAGGAPRASGVGGAPSHLSPVVVP